MRELRRIGLLSVAVITGYLLQLIKGDVARLVINPSGQTQSQPAGIGFGLTCQGEAENTDLFQEMKWISPKEVLSEGSSGPIEVSRTGSTLLLMFKSPTADDSGLYNCSASYDSIDQLSTSVNIIFYQDITWEDCPEQQALVINSNGKIRCRVSANPPAVITWNMDKNPVPDRYTTETDGVKVTGVTEDDKGQFKVRAMVTQTGRFQSRVINVEVHVPPDVIELDENVEAVEGNEARLNCKASGFPRPVYSWFDPGQRDLSDVEGYIVDQDNGALTIQSVKRDDRGSYTCMAKNPAGETKRSLDLTVIVKPEIREFSNVTTVEDQVAMFECHATGDPLPEMSIRKDGIDRPFSEGDDRIFLTKRDEADKSILTLTVQRTFRSDDGLYYCAAENKGAHVERVGHLTVEFSPVLSLTPSTSVKTWNENPVNLTCIAEAIPNATISWWFLGQEIRESPVYTVFGRSSYSNLLVHPSRNTPEGSSVYGTYKCQAENNHGTQYINIELQEARPPAILLQTTTEKKTATTITFKFHGPKDDGGLPIQSFVVKYHEENQPYDEAKLHEWKEGIPYILENLKPRTAYKFRFAAKNDVAIGDWSDEERIVMPAESAPEPPKFTTRNNVSTYPDRFEVRWTLPLDNGRPIDYFELRYFEVERMNGGFTRIGDSIVKDVKDWENAPLYEIREIKPNSYYKVEVRAHNDIGFSQDATMIFRTPEDPSKRSQGNSPKNFSGPNTNGAFNSNENDGSPLSTAGIAAIIVALVLIILIILDVTCYARYQWGLLYFLRTRVCGKPMGNKAKEAAAEDGKGGGKDAATNNGKVKAEANDAAPTEKGGEHFEKKSRTEVDNPAFDKEKEPFQSPEETEKPIDGDVATEDTPMIQSHGAKDTKTSDGTTDDMKNKSPKGSKSSIAKDSLV